jgi:hypothetical protein
VVIFLTRRDSIGPVEKLWRFLKQKAVSLHQEKGFASLHGRADVFLDYLPDGS